MCVCVYVCRLKTLSVRSSKKILSEWSVWFVTTRPKSRRKKKSEQR